MAYNLTTDKSFSVSFTDRFYTGTIFLLDDRYVFTLYESFDDELPILKIKDFETNEYLKEDDELYQEFKERIMSEIDI